MDETADLHLRDFDEDAEVHDLDHDRVVLERLAVRDLLGEEAVLLHLDQVARRLLGAELRVGGGLRDGGQLPAAGLRGRVAREHRRELTVEHEVGVAADRRGEVAVESLGQAEVPLVLDGVLRALHAAQHEHAHVVLERRPVDGLEQPREVAGVHEVAGLESERGDRGRQVRDLLGIGGVVEARDVGDVAARELGGDGFVRGDHRLLDELVRDRMDRRMDADHHAVGVEVHLHFGRGDVQREALEAVRAELLRERVEREHQLARLGRAELRGGRGAVDDLLRLFVGEAQLRADHRARQTALDDDAGGIERQERGEREAVFARHEAADAVGELFGQHRNHLVDQVHARAALARLGIEFGTGAHEMGDVRDVHAENAPTFGVVLKRERIVEVLGGGGVDRDDELAAQVLAAVVVGELGGDGLGFAERGRREIARQAVHADDRLGVERGVVGGADHPGDLGVGVEQRVVPGGEAHDDAVALLRALGVRDVERVLVVGDHRHGGEILARAAQRADDVGLAALEDLLDAAHAAPVAAARRELRDGDAVAGQRLPDGLLRDDDVLAAVVGGDEARAAAGHGEHAGDMGFERRLARERADRGLVEPELLFSLDHLSVGLVF